jgi:hypothetical protein
MQCTYHCNTEVHYRNHCCHPERISIIYSECVSVALVIQQAQCTLIILSFVACLTLTYFSHYLINGTSFRKKVIEHKLFYDFLYNCCLKCFSLYKQLTKILS